MAFSFLVNSPFLRSYGGELKKLAIDMSLTNSARSIDKRETFFEDRTLCHADHVGDGLERRTTAAVGVLKAIHISKKLALQIKIKKNINSVKKIK